MRVQDRHIHLTIDYIQQIVFAYGLYNSVIAKLTRINVVKSRLWLNRINQLATTFETG